MKTICLELKAFRDLVLYLRDSEQISSDASLKLLCAAILLFDEENFLEAVFADPFFADVLDCIKKAVLKDETCLKEVPDE